MSDPRKMMTDAFGKNVDVPVELSQLRDEYRMAAYKHRDTMILHFEGVSAMRDVVKVADFFKEHFPQAIPNITSRVVANRYALVIPSNLFSQAPDADSLQ